MPLLHGWRNGGGHVIQNVWRFREGRKFGFEIKFTMKISKHEDKDEVYENIEFHLFQK